MDPKKCPILLTNSQYRQYEGFAMYFPTVNRPANPRAKPSWQAPMQQGIYYGRTSQTPHVPNLYQTRNSPRG